jgi:hypothetical protein
LLWDAILWFIVKFSEILSALEAGSICLYFLEFEWFLMGFGHLEQLHWLLLGCGDGHASPDLEIEQAPETFFMTVDLVGTREAGSVLEDAVVALGLVGAELARDWTAAAITLALSLAFLAEWILINRCIFVTAQLNLNLSWS